MWESGSRFGSGGSCPDILWDGYVNEDRVTADGRLKPEYRIWVDNGDVEVLNVDLPNDSANVTVGDEQHDCRDDSLNAIELNLPGP